MSLSSVLGTLPVSSGVHVIKSTHSCVKSRTYLEICFASIPGASSYHYYAPRSYLLRDTFISLYVATYYKEHLFFYEVVSRKITFIHVPRGGPLSVTHSKKDPCSPPCSTRQIYVPRSTSHDTRPFLPEEVNPVSFTYTCTLYHTDPLFCFEVQLVLEGAESFLEMHIPLR